MDPVERHVPSLGAFFLWWSLGLVLAGLGILGCVGLLMYKPGYYSSHINSAQFRGEPTDWHNIRAVFLKKAPNDQIYLSTQALNDWSANSFEAYLKGLSPSFIPPLSLSPVQPPIFFVDQNRFSLLLPVRLYVLGVPLGPLFLVQSEGNFQKPDGADGFRYVMNKLYLGKAPMPGFVYSALQAHLMDPFLQSSEYQALLPRWRLLQQVKVKGDRLILSQTPKPKKSQAGSKRSRNAGPAQAGSDSAAPETDTLHRVDSTSVSYTVPIEHPESEVMGNLPPGVKAPVVHHDPENMSNMPAGYTRPAIKPSVPERVSNMPDGVSRTSSGSGSPAPVSNRP